MIGADILEIRKMRNMTRSLLAEKSGVSTATIVRIENNETSPSYDVVEKLLEAMGFELMITKVKCKNNAV